jgi:hypothetical protein
MYDHRMLIFVASVLYSIEEKWLGVGFSQSFEDILRGSEGVNLHLAWQKLKNEGLLGEFADNFYFDTLYGTSNLTEVLERVSGLYGLIRLGGSDLSYHLDEVSQSTIKSLLEEEMIPIELVQKVAARLNELLDEQTILAESPTE